jgi:hypothetical protein
MIECADQEISVCTGHSLKAAQFTGIDDFGVHYRCFLYWLSRKIRTKDPQITQIMVEDLASVGGRETLLGLDSVLRIRSREPQNEICVIRRRCALARQVCEICGSSICFG